MVLLQIMDGGFNVLGYHTGCVCQVVVFIVVYGLLIGIGLGFGQG